MTGKIAMVLHPKPLAKYNKAKMPYAIICNNA